MSAPDPPPDDTGRIRLDVADGVAWVVLSNPGRANAITPAMRAELVSAWAQVNDDPQILVAVVTGDGDRHFCSGADVRLLASPGAYLGRHEANRTTARDCGVAKPVIAAVTGIAVGPGVAFVTDADIVIASRNARFLDPHVRLGQVVGSSALNLAARIGPSEAARLVLAGAELSAERAHQLGFVTELCDTPQEARAAAGRLAATIAGSSPTTVSASLGLLRRLAENERLDDLVAEARSIAESRYDHPDVSEGPSAWLAGRDARWAPGPDS